MNAQSKYHVTGFNFIPRRQTWWRKIRKFFARRLN